MDKADKIKQLRRLSEQVVRRDVLVPLLGRMGFSAVGEYHGPREVGKDIVCFYLDKLKERRYLGIVAKTSDLTGSVSSREGLWEVLRQVEQCFNEPYHDLFGMRQLTMDEVWIVTTGRLIPGAADSIFGTLQKTNLAKLTRVVHGETIVELLDEYYPTYWNVAAESSDQIRSQRDRILSFARDLLRKLGITGEQEAAVISTLLHSAWTPSVEHLGDGQRRVVGATSYSVTISDSVSTYPDGLVSEYGDLWAAYQAAKDEVAYELYKVEDILEKAGRALGAGDPREFVSLFDKNLRRDYPFCDAPSSDALRKVDYLSEGLNDVDRLLKRLDTSGRRQEYLQLVESLRSLQSEIADYLQGVDEERFSLNWDIEGVGPNRRVVCLYSHGRTQASLGFVTSHELSIEVYSRWGNTRRPVTPPDVMVAAQQALREIFEKQLPPGVDDE